MGLAQTSIKLERFRLMDRAETFIDSFLEHVGTKYYDPVKAHEYYLRNRELTGRKASDLRTEAKKTAWAYSKSKIGEAKQKESEQLAESKKASFEQTRKVAEQRRTEIREKLRVLMERLTENITKESKDATAKIQALPPIPKGLSKEAAAKAHTERREEIAKIRGEVAKDREAAGSEKKSARTASSAELEQVRGEMKATLETARSNYTKLKESLKAKYETESQQEFEAIRENV